MRSWPHHVAFPLQATRVAGAAMTTTRPTTVTTTTLVTADMVDIMTTTTTTKDTARAGATRAATTATKAVMEDTVDTTKVRRTNLHLWYTVVETRLTSGERRKHLRKKQRSNYLALITFLIFY